MNFKKILSKDHEELFLMLSFIGLILLVFIQVVARYILNVSVGWSAELSRYLLIWITWISASYAIKREEHIRIKLLTDKMPETGRKYIEVFVLFIWTFFATIMAWGGTQMILVLHQTGQQTSTLGISSWIPYLIVPIAGMLIIIRVIEQFILIFKKGV